MQPNSRQQTCIPSTYHSKDANPRADGSHSRDDVKLPSLVGWGPGRVRSTEGAQLEKVKPFSHNSTLVPLPVVQGFGSPESQLQEL